MKESSKVEVKDTKEKVTFLKQRFYPYLPFYIIINYVRIKIHFTGSKATTKQSLVYFKNNMFVPTFVFQYM